MLYSERLAKCFRRFENLFGPGAHPVILGEVKPAHGAGRIQQELSRPRNVLAIDSGAGMNKIELAAAFTHANMPPGASADSALISEQDAWNVAAFVTTRPRPPAPANSPPRPSGL